MIKSELISSLAKEYSNLPEQDIAQSVNHLLELMSKTLGDHGRIEIRGFGSFCLHYRAPRNAHNPKTGKRIVTEEKYRPHFKPGKELKDRVNSARDVIGISSEDSDEE